MFRVQCVHLESFNESWQPKGYRNGAVVRKNDQRRCAAEGEKLSSPLLMSRFYLKKIFQSKDQRELTKLFYTSDGNPRIRNDVIIVMKVQVFDIWLVFAKFDDVSSGLPLNVCHANEMIRLRQSSKCLSASLLSFDMTFQSPTSSRTRQLLRNVQPVSSVWKSLKSSHFTVSFTGNSETF